MIHNQIINIQYQLMILLRSRLLRFFHFTKPALSRITSRQDLESVLHKRLLRNIAEVNAQTLQHHSFATLAQQKLLFSESAARQLEERSIAVSLTDPASNQQHVAEVRLGQSLEKLQLEGFNLGLPFSSPNQALRHFSHARGTPNFQELQEYDCDDCSLRIFNLPENITEQDIQATLKTSDAKVTFKYCILGLPAYARATFQTAQELQACLQKLPTRRIAFGERVAVVRGPEEGEKLRLGYRRMVVQLQEDSQLEDMVVQLSRFGRVLHLDWPLEASLNPTLPEVKEFYKSSTELVRINQIHKDGTVRSEFYPPVSAWKGGQDDRGEDNIIERAQRLKEQYEHRSRFAKNVNVHVGKEHKQSVIHRGYCVVTYSTYQQCQSLYFAYGAETKMQLVAEQLDFEFDPLFKRELLRQIDNEYLLGKKIALRAQQQHEKDFVNPVKEGVSALQFSYKDPLEYRNDYKPKDDLKLFEKIFNRICFTELSQAKEVTSYFLQDAKDRNVFTEWAEYVDKYDGLKKKLTRKTFDEMAELELFGRVLPKDQSIERFVVEDPTLRKSREAQLIEENNLLTSHRDVMARNKFYRRHQERNNRMANQREGLNIPQDQPAEAVEGEAEQAVNDGENIGKAAFSTHRPSILYRKRTAEEEAHYQFRYHQFVRSTIYEYMGVFHDKQIEEVADIRSELVNPQSLRWADGRPYLSQQEVEDALQFRRDLAGAQQQYEDFIYGSEYVRSSGIHLRQINANRKTLRDAAVQHLTDVGLVESVRAVSGDDLQRKVQVLNAQTAQFGEQYRLEEQEGRQLLVKVRKVENLLPLDRVSHLQAFIAEHGEGVTPEQAALFEKHYPAMQKGEVIPDEVSDAFGVERGFRLNDLLAEVGATHQIYKKDLQMAERAKSYSPRQLQQDINEQINLQRSRRNHRKLGNNSFAKDPSEIYAKDREGYYRVSRYRQI